jgi:hypothetical protein
MTSGSALNDLSPIIFRPAAINGRPYGAGLLGKSDSERVKHNAAFVDRITAKGAEFAKHAS